MEYDFQDFQPMIFSVDITTGTLAGSSGENSVAVNDRPFIIKEIHHQIINPVRQINDPPDTSVQVMQDGLYRINWSLYNQRRYFQGAVPLADTAFGSVRHGVWIPLPVPIPIDKNRTINVEVTNAIDRADPLVKSYFFHVEFHGLEDLRGVTRRDREVG